MNDEQIKTWVYSNGHEIGSGNWKKTRREAVLQPCPLDVVRASMMVLQKPMCIAKCIRRGVWLYNCTERVPNWSAAKGVGFALIVEIGEAEEEKARRRYTEAMANKVSAGLGLDVDDKMMALAYSYDMGSELFATKVNAGGLIVDPITKENIKVYGKSEYFDAAVSEFDVIDEQSFLDLKREPWKKR